MCGVVGVVSKSEVSPMIYDALTVLQHRGQDAAGIATCHQDKFHLRKQLGLVRDVFTTPGSVPADFLNGGISL